jgi:hypothetical protein
MVHSADVDIDLGKGLAHAQEWLVNNVFRPGHKTNQALVYALLFAQGILPLYSLDPAPATTRRAAPRLRSLVPAPQRLQRGGRGHKKTTRTPPRSLKRLGTRPRSRRKSRGR